jgi:hypothetical protein
MSTKDAKHQKFRITFELEPIATFCHADALHAAKRIADAIDRVRVGDHHAPQVARILRMTVEQIEPPDGAAAPAR